MNRNDYLNKQHDQVLADYQNLYEVSSTIKDKCFQVLPNILNQMRIEYDDAFDIANCISKACESITHGNDAELTFKMIEDSGSTFYPLAKYSHIQDKAKFHLYFHLAKNAEVISLYEFSTGYHSRREWPDIANSQEIKQLREKINGINSQHLLNISNFDGEIKAIDKMNVEHSPVYIRERLYAAVVNDFILNSFAVDRVKDTVHLAEILSKYEAEHEGAMRLLIKDYTAQEGNNQYVKRLFSKHKDDWPMPRAIIENMQIIINAMPENSDKSTKQQFTAQSAMLQILAAHFQRLEHAEKLSAYHTITSNSAFDMNVLGEHFQSNRDAHNLLNRFAINHHREIEEFKSCHQLANLIDDELQNITALENEVRQSDGLSIQNAL